jgi:tetratricopeptide (TPR) repeat protein
MAPAEAIRGFLDALAVPVPQIPVGLEAQASLYSRLLAGRRMLIVLDNAQDADQVWPLLPRTPGCLVVVTSRRHLTGLVAAGNVHPLTLGLLTDAEAGDLLARHLGPGRITAEPAAAGEIVRLCAGLPLALSIAAARAASHPGPSLGGLAADLRDVRRPLNALDGGDAATDIRAVLSWSYQQLSMPSAGMFRLLGVHPGPDITVPAAASLAGVSPDRARAALTELTRANVLTELAPGRFGFHDLLRAYAAEQAQVRESDDDRHEAVHRVLDHYLHTAQAADRLLHPARDPLVLAPASPAATPEDVTDLEHALAWCQAEHAVLLAAIDQAARTGFDTHAWQIPRSLLYYFQRLGHWRDLATTQQTALAAAQRLGDQEAQAHACRGVGRAMALTGSPDDARARLRQALDLFRQRGDHSAQAHTHLDLGQIAERQGRYQDALGHCERALGLYRTAGNRDGQANALNNIGWFHTILGNHQQGLTCCQRALDLHRELGDRTGEASTMDSLGYAYHHLGRHAQALACYQRATDLHREVGDRYNQADSLDHLGDTHRAAGNPEAARIAWQQASAILDDLSYPDAGSIRTKLQAVARAGITAGADPAERAHGHPE